VTFVGSVQRPELVALYNACDIFVLTPVEIRHGHSLDSEGFGLVFLEAGACGKPVIGSAASGCVESISHEQTGLLVEPGNAGALASAIRRLIDDPPLGRRLGEESRRRIRAAGGWASVAEQILQCYGNLVRPG